MSPEPNNTSSGVELPLPTGARGVSLGDETAPDTIWRRLFERARDAQIVTDTRGRVLAATAAATQLLESRECPLLGSSLVGLVARSDRGRIRALLRRVREAPGTDLQTELEVRTADGEMASVAASVLGLHDEGERLEAVGWMLRPMETAGSFTDRLQLIRQEASDLRAALDLAAAVVELDRRGRVRDVNERCAGLIGRAPEELVGCAFAELKLGSGFEHRLPDIRRRVMRGRAWGGELPMETGVFGPRWVNTTVVPLLDVDGRPRGYLALLHDVTSQREALDRLEREKGLVRLGAMAAVVAHEVRNPLAAAQGALEIITPRVPSEQDREVLVDVRERLAQLNQLVNDILLYARPRPLELAEHDIGDLVDRVVQEMVDDPGMEAIELSVQRPNRPCHVPLDDAAIRALLLNLVRNAAEAMKGQGRIHLAVERCGEWCRLSVRDEGPGIPEDMRETIFEPFVSTRHRGSGLGLAISRNTAEAHGGHLHLEPAPEGGTVAVLQLRAQGPPP